MGEPEVSLVARQDVLAQINESRRTGAAAERRPRRATGMPGNYGVLEMVFPYVMHGDLAELRDAARRLTEPEPSFAAEGSSFALTVRPTPVLWLSAASKQRLAFPGGDEASYDEAVARRILLSREE